LKTPLLRRELFDARFQLISQENQASSEKGKEKANPGEEYVVAKSDLIPGLYEGGLKTWEGGVDLVEVLSEGAAKVPSLLRSKRILEVRLSISTWVR
jgi:protein-histidine N-methyltransferase